MTSSLEKFQTIPMDEQIIPFKGYNPKKPKRWGYKIFVLSENRGMVYNFEVYTGQISPCWPTRHSGNIVLSLSRLIPDNTSHKLFFDNWFSSVDLQMILEKRKIHCISTVRANGLPGCSSSTDTDMKKKGRGTFEEKETMLNGVPLRVVKWYDNRATSLLSTFASANPTTTVMR